jgi:hypothetical protein
MKNPHSLYGTVFIAQRLSVMEAPTEYYGHWEYEINNVPERLVGPGWSSARDAVAWGRSHAPIVLIRLGSEPPQKYFSAGDVTPFAGRDVRELPAWRDPGD